MAKRQSAKTPSQRQLKLGEVIRHALSDVFLRVEVQDDDLTGVILTATEVQVSPDGKHATVYIIPLGTADQEVITKALNRHAPFLRGEVSRRVAMQFTPALVFKSDESFNEGSHMDALLNSPKVRQDLD